MRSAAPRIRYLTRVVIFTVSLTLFLGWLAAPEALRAGRDAAASYIPLPAEAAYAVSSDVAPVPTPEGGATALALAALLVLTFGFGVPRKPVDSGLPRPSVRSARAFAPVAPRVSPPRRVRRVSVSFAFVLALGLFLGWMSAPDFVRRHEMSVAALQAGDEGGTTRGDRSTHLMDGFSSWIGPAAMTGGSDPLANVPLNLLEAVPQTTDLLDLEVFEDAETLLAELEETEAAGAALLADEDLPRRARATARKSSRSGSPAPRVRQTPGSAVEAGSASSPVFLASSSGAASASGAPSADPAPAGDASGATPDDGGPGGEQVASNDNPTPNDGGNGGNPGPGQDGNNSSDDDGDRRPAGPLGLVDTQPVLGEIFIRFEDAAEGTAIADLLAAIGGEISRCFDVIDDCVVKVSNAVDPLRLVEDLRAQPIVASATANFVRLPATAPQDTLFPLQWSLDDPLIGKDIGALGAWKAMAGVPASSKVKIALIDTSVDTLHPDLSAVIKKAHTVSSGIGSVPDHGTNVAGILAARGDAFGISGVNREWAELHVFDVFNTVSVGTAINNFVTVFGAKDTVIVEAIQKAKAIGVRVVNLSLAGSKDSAALCGAIAASPNVLFVAAAGNGGGSEPVYPANCPGDNVIAVASLDRTGQVAVTSNRGGWVEIAAPGDLILTTQPGASYVAASGTSMAAPHVAGVASMMFAKHPAYSPAEVRATLIGSRGRFDRLDACKALGGSDC